MKQTNKNLLRKWESLCGILFIQLFLSVSFATSPVVKEECVLIINANPEFAPLSNQVIGELIYSLPSEYKGTTIVSENLNLVQVQNEEQMDTVRMNLFTKYVNKKPKLIIVMGGNTWVLVHEELEKHWKDVPIILFAEKDYLASPETYLQKLPVDRNEQISLKSVIRGRNMTVVYAPLYVKETIELMYKQIPDMDELIFISDRRWFSAQNRQEVAETVVKYYPNLKLRFLTEGQKAMDEVVDSLKRVNGNTGILYAAWESSDTLLSRPTLLIHTYRVVSQYAVRPVFTLTDMVGQIGLVGGYFSQEKDISKAIANVTVEILNGKKASDIPITKVVAGPVFNYEEMLRVGLRPKLCPPETFFYYRPVGFVEQNRYMLGVTALCVVFGIIILLVRIRFLNNIRKMQAKQILLMSNYNNLFDDMPVVYLKCTLIRGENGGVEDYIISDVNPSFEKHFWTKEETLGKRGSVLNSPEVYTRFKEYMDVADREHKSVSFPVHAVNGHNYDVLIMASNIPGIVNIFCMDTTELIHTRQSLQTINHKLSMVLSMVDITPWKWHTKEEVVWFDANKPIDEKEWLEVKEGAFAVPVSKILQGIHKDYIKHIKRVFQDLMSGKIKKVNEQFRILSIRGTEFDWVEVWAVVDETDETGKPLTLIGSALTITDRKKMEEELIASKEKAEEANRLKSAFIANISHEIRTPLNAIVGFSGVLDSAKTDEERKEYLRIIEHNNQLLLQLINDVIDLSKIEAGTLDFATSNIFLDDLMKELERTFRFKLTSNEVSLHFDDTHAQCYIRSDRNRLMQVMNNLLSNAVKFTPKGSIHFGFSCIENNMLRFYVTDTGPGIPKEYQTTIFGRFVKLNSFIQGIGLGLAICETIVKYMGGDIGVESESGKGATFWFTIPYQPIKGE